MPDQQLDAGIRGPAPSGKGAECSSTPSWQKAAASSPPQSLLNSQSLDQPFFRRYYPTEAWITVAAGTGTDLVKVVGLARKFANVEFVV